MRHARGTTARGMPVSRRPRLPTFWPTPSRPVTPPHGRSGSSRRRQGAPTDESAGESDGGDLDVTTIKKILCAIDLTKASRNAFDRALSIARVSGARLYILHAVPKKHPFSWQASERLELLTSLRQRAEREEVPVRVVEQHGDPARVIVLHANSRK